MSHYVLLGMFVYHAGLISVAMNAATLSWSQEPSAAIAPMCLTLGLYELSILVHA